MVRWCEMLSCAFDGRHALIAVIWWLSLPTTTGYTRKAEVSIQNNPDGSSVLKVGDAAAIEFLRRPSPLVDQRYRLYDHGEDSSLMDNSSRWTGAGPRGCLVSGELKGEHVGWAAVSTCPHLLVLKRAHMPNVQQGFVATQHGGYLLYSSQQGHSYVDKIFGAPRVVPQLHARRKRYTSDAFHIRVLLLADHSVRQHHKSRRDAEQYLLAIMNIVHHVFHDQSLGHAVSVSLAGTVFLSQRQSKAINNSSTICAWQNSLRKQDRTPPHDIAVFFTRQPVCHRGSSSHCEHTVGYSLVGSICDEAASCIAVKDHGLTSAFTIAHEIGHSLGLIHDGRKAACPTNVFIMSPEVVKLAHPYQWSPCSKEEFHNLVQSGQLHCLRRKRPVSGQDHSQVHVYTLDEQCRFRHGKTASSCTNEMSACQLLWCRTDAGQCTTDGHPPADGTGCRLPGGAAAQGSCYRGSCVSRNSTALQPADGGWSKWSAWSACSCSCGTGVAASSRNCTSPAPRNGGRPCVGVRTRYKTCNTQMCTAGHVVVHKQNQCQARNSQWTAVSNAEVHRMALNPCQLHCIANNSTLLSNIGPVLDGTHCWSHRNDVCIQGECVTVGCDLQLNSGMILDQCGVCGGNGSSCITVSREILTGNQIGFRHIITFPRHATHIVLGLHHSSTVVVITDVATGASWLLRNDSSFAVGGAQWARELSGMKKTLIAPGPLKHSVAVMVYSLAVNVEVQYSFVLPRGIPGRHQWQETVDKGELVCMDLTTGNRKAEEACGSKKLLTSLGLATSNATQGQLGSYSWWTSQWSQCRGVCEQGKEVRAVFCLGRDLAIINDTYCSSPMPQLARQCSVTDKCLYSWKTDEWGNCSTTCGSGNQTRSVHCVSIHGQRVNSAFCVPSLKPVESTKCFANSSCGKWMTSKWAECQGQDCSTGTQIRDVSCVGSDAPGGAQNAHHCLQQERPPVKRTCSVPCVPSTSNETSCVDSLSPRFCQYVVTQHYCNVQDYAEKCCESCNARK